ncbi:TIGR02301 family protein [Parvibaculum sp.]|uniref:TIGR02301 family protein n=1 Tax=Parvibaculum sp. TaxID=2024848 RepID=UPI0027316632|nr:TIGR02301 family protein [Parvibaculum sp.]MDP1626818.1 TIGR02301 family protein [Parvibaculum sp.]MDP2148464.1 TIGR02301 family protein [Parvibaculum sp.]MDP3329719.1 TIGR02301 family protein [Parvibaculum sp.]
MEQGLSIFDTYGFMRRRKRAVCALLAALMLAAAPLPHARALALPGTMLQLAEVLGAVHHLRTLCGTNEGPLWRNKMIEMMSVANPSETERQQLIQRFNDAYHRYQDAYRNCTAKAASQSDKLMLDGQRLADELASGSYGR